VAKKPLKTRKNLGAAAKETVEGEKSYLFSKFPKKSA
jgi:hypothetical protein